MCLGARHRNLYGAIRVGLHGADFASSSALLKILLSRGDLEILQRHKIAWRGFLACAKFRTASIQEA